MRQLRGAGSKTACAPGHYAASDRARISPRSRHHQVRAPSPQGACLAAAVVDGHDDVEAARASGLDSVDGRLEHGRAFGRNAEPAAGGEQHVGGRLPAQPLRAHRRPVHSRVDQVGQARALEQVGHGGAARDDRAPDTRLVRQLEEEAGALVGLHAARVQQATERLALVARKSVHRPDARRLVGRALGKAQPPAREELPDRIVARASVDVQLVVGLDAEGNERASRPVDGARKQRVEGLLPRIRMRCCAGDEDAVDAEDTCSDPGRKPEQPPRIPRGADETDEEPFLAANPGERLEQSHRGVPLLRETRGTQAKLARREIARSRLERRLR